MARSGTKSDERLIAELVTDRRVYRAAVAAGVSTRTAFRRLQDPQFRQRLADARYAPIGEAVSLLGRAAAPAAGVLVELLVSKDERVRMSAARTLLELGVRYRETEAVEEQLAEFRRELDEVLVWVPRRTEAGLKGSTRV